MPLPRSLLRALTAAATITVGLIGATTLPSATAYAAPARAAADGDPLTVEILTVSPGVIPQRGRITVTGTVTNDSDEQWRVIKVYPLTSVAPFTTPEQLAEAAASDPETPFGDRITTEGYYDTIDVLDPGDAQTFRVSVPRSALTISGEPGVHWLGVHALGETDAGREEVAVADGRDRVFVPLLDPPTNRGNRPAAPQRRVDTALVVPVRHDVTYAPDGSLADPEAWAEDLAVTGVLGRLVSLAQSAGGRPLTWLIDPAVTDAVARLGQDNPPRSLDDLEPDPDDPDASSSPGDGESPSDPEPEESADAAGSTAARTGLPPPNAWLARLQGAIATDDLLGLPYGDIDVAAAADVDPGLFRLARQRTDGTVEALALPVEPVVAPPGGFLDEAGFAAVPSSTTVLANDQILQPTTRAASPAVITAFDRRVYVSNTSVLAGSGGQQDSFVDVRQRLLAEALVRMLDRRGPLIVTLPTGADATWDAADIDDLFATVDQAAWIRLTTLDGFGDRRARPVRPGQLRYPDRIEGLELRSEVFASAQALISRGSLLDSILPRNDTVTGQVQDEALTTVSYADRADAPRARAAANAARAWIDDRLSRITVETPPSVTLSSDEGRLSADVVNGLEQTVRVRVQAATDPGLEITPTPVQELGPGERATVQMEATATTLAVHYVSLIVADENGQPVGTAASFPLRANRVSQVIWVIIGAGAVLLFATIGVRVSRRVRRSLSERRTRGAGPAEDGS